MRKYADIITDLKSGKTVEYEEARLAAIMAANLYFLANQDVAQLVKSRDNGLVQKVIQENNRKRNFAACKVTPEEWLGREHPDNREYLKRIEIEGKLLDSVLRKHSQERRKTMLDYIAEHDTELIYLVERKDREGMNDFLKHMTEYADLCMA